MRWSAVKSEASGCIDCSPVGCEMLTPWHSYGALYTMIFDTGDPFWDDIVDVFSDTKSSKFNEIDVENPMSKFQGLPGIWKSTSGMTGGRPNRP
jgi:hypothetical protein